jgi:hypothetical protein
MRAKTTHDQVLHLFRQKEFRTFRHQGKFYCHRSIGGISETSIGLAGVNKYIKGFEFSHKSKTTASSLILRWRTQ